MRIIKTKKYLEEQARQTLCQVCGYDINGLFCNDKPDIQDKNGNCGIEVVIDIEEDIQELTAFIENVCDTPYDQIDPLKIKHFQSKGGKITKIVNNKICSAFIGENPDNPAHLIKTIKKKVDLLNASDYKHFENYSLYVFVNTVSIDESFDSYVLDIMNSVALQHMDHTFSLRL